MATRDLAIPPLPRSYPRPMVKPALTRSRVSHVLPAVLLVCASALPPEIRISVADQTFFAWRMVGLALLPWVIFDLSRNPIKPQVWDFAIGLAVIWMVFAFAAYYGPNVGIVRGGALAIDVAVPYIVGRASIRSPNDFRLLVVMVTPAIAFVGGSMLLESVMSRPLVRPAAVAVFGGLPQYDGGEVIGIREGSNYDVRLGLLRVAGPFSHPILAGLFLFSFVPFYLQSGVRRWPLYIGVIATFFGVLSLSSGALLLMMLGLALVAYDRFQSRTTFLSWTIFIPAAVAALLTVHLIAEKGIINVIGRFTLDPQTAHFRTLIWEYGTQSVARNPLIGIGFDNYERLSWMPPSVDNQWLLLAIRFGVIPAFAILAAVLLILINLGSWSKKVPEMDRRFFVGVAIGLFSLTILGFTVAFYGGLQSWYYTLLGICATLAVQPQRQHVTLQHRSHRMPRRP